MNIGKYSHVTQAVQDLHWPVPVSARIQFKILILVFKAIHRLAPPYISDLITVKPKFSYNLRLIFLINFYSIVLIAPLYHLDKVFK